ncbi:hypothetical protein GCK72_026012 [Caenorhabditis remanei]|uniref:C2H2-type domain-containing protein n=1 Tax=Caenorhabditis remanei TaxID=31234 RepID=A0A6A5G4N4_CAERE|nr:hypothetical protein GCK72_026012 [Caenorhabditis remanei]KAF1749544.1 hypothetical protein GCK72_026012 [Caenorhabditis remanei]
MERPKKSSKIKQDPTDDMEGSAHSTPQPSKPESQGIPCGYCSTVCSSIKHLQMHTLNDHFDLKESAFHFDQQSTCQACGKTFANFAQFATHMKSHSPSLCETSPEFFQCPICSQDTTWRTKKCHMEHLTFDHFQIKTVQLICAACNAVYSTDEEFSNHFIEIHKKFKCASCDFEGANKSDFQTHAENHCKKTDTLECVLCRAKFSNQQNLVHHVQLAHLEVLEPLVTVSPILPAPKPPRKLRKIQCSICGDMLLGEDKLESHKLQMHCKIRYAEKCAGCQELLINKNTFMKHCIKHSRNERIYCPVCSQFMTTDRQVRAHCAFHMPPVSPPESSDSATTSASASSDETEKEFVCQICGEKIPDFLLFVEHSAHHNLIAKD